MDVQINALEIAVNRQMLPERSHRLNVQAHKSKARYLGLCPIRPRDSAVARKEISRWITERAVVSRNLGAGG